PRGQIRVVLFDDLKRDPLKLMQDLYRFLRVDPTFVPDFDTPHNVGGMPASMFLENVFTSRALKSALAPLLPTRAVNWVRRLRTRNMQRAPDLPPALRQDLTAGFREDIEKTSDLIGRSLAHWL
ncbi:MAG TPA: hypothetical protein VD930_13480, partial [Gemmatimonadales bacterium]|nr:hypothetical protein [Gemmatimonadales bacterium]